uniref:PH domain-containing protein n=1 Tax=Panagrellus redivivus TaxID=6233 RepID=A0A7E4V228_PANRE
MYLINTPLQITTATKVAAIIGSRRNTGDSVAPSSPSSSQISPLAAGEEWFSLEGYLNLKGAGALPLFPSKKRLYFGLEELENRLVYYKDKNDFDKKANRIGVIALADSACTVAETNVKGFIIHADKKYELEADNEDCANCWLHALQHRKDINSNDIQGSLPAQVFSNLRRHRSRSRSLNSGDDRGHSPIKFLRQRKINRKVKSFRHGAGFNLEVPRRTLHRMKSLNVPSMNSNTSSSDVPSLAVPGTAPPVNDNIESMKLPRKSLPFRKTSAPLWLNDWISQWISEQSEGRGRCESDEVSHESTAKDTSTTDDHPSHQQSVASASTSSSSSESNSSRTTSTYNSEDEQDDPEINLGNENLRLASEITLLRMIDNRQKDCILELTEDKKMLEKEVEKLKQIVNQPVGPSGGTQCQSAQNRFLNSEVLRLNERYQQAERKIAAMGKHIDSLTAEMEDFKKEYVFLLQSCVRIPLHEHSNFDVIQVKLFGGNIHTLRVCKLLALAREHDPTLPTLERVTNPISHHVDEYGFKHCFEDTSLAIHYICTLLHEHYLNQSEEYVKKKHRWSYLLNHEHGINNNHEVRELCRAGIPRSLRSKVWRVLINQQIADVKSKFGNYYYRNLCQSHGSAAEKHYINVHQKQINLDLLRTMPNNIHFMSATCQGVTSLQAILRAYCLHNPTIGYCQGMNFIAATVLLFVSPEDAFWFLVAITERYFDRSYFDESLTGAQADQEVLKEILETRFPRLAAHLEEYDIDLTTITLNWFMSLFFDALPFQSMLRVWDCFLLEGSRVLFRISIALLGLYEQEILSRSDTISVIKVLKAAVRLTYDIDGLIQYAFNSLPSFPTKSQLASKQQVYLTILQERLLKRQQIRNMYAVEAAQGTPNSDKLCDLPVVSVAFASSKSDPCIGYVCVGNQNRGKVAMISMYKEGAANLNLIDLEFDCRPVSMVVYENGMGFISLLSGYIVAVQLEPAGKSEILWELKLSDVALKLIHSDDKLYCALANGTLTVLEHALNRSPSNFDFYHIPISAAPISDAIIIDDDLYLAVACKLVILNKHTLSPIGNIYVAASAAGSTVPMFEKIRALCDSEHGIWIITAHSSLVQLWKESECQLLFDVTYDHSHRKPSFDEHDDFDAVEIHTILYFDNEIWIGTVDGYLMLYHVSPSSETSESSEGRQRRPSCSNEISFSLHRYPPGKRLTPDNSVATSLPPHRQHMYYIPTPRETHDEENASCAEILPTGRATRKVSVVIDSLTRQYSVSVAPVRSISVDSAHETCPTLSSSTVPSPLTKPNGLNLNLSVPPKATVKRNRSFPSKRLTVPRLEKNLSIDSAVSSVFDGDGRTSPMALEEDDLESDGNLNDSRESDQFMVSPIVEGSEREASCSPMFSTGGSLEYDDMFEMYSEPDAPHEIGLAEESLFDRSPPPHSKLVQIPVRKMSNSIFGPSDALTIDRQCSSLSDSRTVIPEGESYSPPIVPNAPATQKLSHSTLPDVNGDYIRAASADSEKTSTTVATETTPHQFSSSNGSKSVETAVPPPKLRRRDLTFDDPVILAVKENVPESPAETGCRQAIDGAELSQIVEAEIKSTVSLHLQMKLKISDKPVKCIALTEFNGEKMVVTGAGNYGDEEAILRWRKEKVTGLWINDPLVDISVYGRKRTVFHSNKSPR